MISAMKKKVDGANASVQKFQANKLASDQKLIQQSQNAQAQQNLWSKMQQGGGFKPAQLQAMKAVPRPKPVPPPAPPAPVQPATPPSPPPPVHSLEDLKNRAAAFSQQPQGQGMLTLGGASGTPTYGQPTATTPTPQQGFQAAQAGQLGLDTQAAGAANNQSSMFRQQMADQQKKLPVPGQQNQGYLR